MRETPFFFCVGFPYKKYHRTFDALKIAYKLNIYYTCVFSSHISDKHTYTCKNTTQAHTYTHRLDKIISGIVLALAFYFTSIIRNNSAQ